MKFAFTVAKTMFISLACRSVLAWQFTHPAHHETFASPVLIDAQNQVALDEQGLTRRKMSERGKGKPTQSKSATSAPSHSPHLSISGSHPPSSNEYVPTQNPTTTLYQTLAVPSSLPSEYPSVPPFEQPSKYPSVHPTAQRNHSASPTNSPLLKPTYSANIGISQHKISLHVFLFLSFILDEESEAKFEHIASDFIFRHINDIELPIGIILSVTSVKVVEQSLFRKHKSRRILGEDTSTGLNVTFTADAKVKGDITGAQVEQSIQRLFDKDADSFQDDLDILLRIPKEITKEEHNDVKLKSKTVGILIATVAGCGFTVILISFFLYMYKTGKKPQRKRNSKLCVDGREADYPIQQQRICEGLSSESDEEMSTSDEGSFSPSVDFCPSTAERDIEQLFDSDSSMSIGKNICGADNDGESSLISVTNEIWTDSSTPLQNTLTQIDLREFDARISRAEF